MPSVSNAEYQQSKARAIFDELQRINCSESLFTIAPHDTVEQAYVVRTQYQAPDPRASLSAVIHELYCPPEEPDAPPRLMVELVSSQYSEQYTFHSPTESDAIYRAAAMILNSLNKSLI